MSQSPVDPATDLHAAYPGAEPPVVPASRGGREGRPNDLELLLQRIQKLSGRSGGVVAASDAPAPEVVSAAPAAAASPLATDDEGTPPARGAVHRIECSADDEIRRETSWYPQEPLTLKEAGVSEGQLEHLLLKCLSGCGDLSGRELAFQHALPFRLVEPILHTLKLGQLVTLRGAAAMGDYIYQLTDMGRERAKKLAEICTYFGAAPVTLRAYNESVAQQTPTRVRPTVSDLNRAFNDLLVNPKILRRLGPAVNSGRGLFLYGQPGNGKTSIAERVTRAFGDCVWIPKAIGIDGEIIRIYDPGMHEEVPLETPSGPLQEDGIDRRWVRIRRPTIVVGGELTMDALEIAPSGLGISEAPLQLKSNCGTLVIDDFGRQRMSIDELLNRWIVPLEKRYDFLRLTNGKKVQVPFDQLIVFSTNLEPKHLVDDAFLRRIPYKIEIGDPSEDEFRQLFRIMAPKLGMECDEGALEYLINSHYKQVGRPFRCCQPRDLLQQVVNYCHYIDSKPRMTTENLDLAVENYFAIM